MMVSEWLTQLPSNMALCSLSQCLIIYQSLFNTHNLIIPLWQAFLGSIYFSKHALETLYHILTVLLYSKH